MVSNNYLELLQHPKWKSLSAKIRKRDGFKCVNCGYNRKLNCHHKYYFFDGRMPWEYPDTCFITLCSKCHSDVHTDQPYLLPATTCLIRDKFPFSKDLVKLIEILCHQDIKKLIQIVEFIGIDEAINILLELKQKQIIDFKKITK